MQNTFSIQKKHIKMFKDIYFIDIYLWIFIFMDIYL